MLQISDSLDAVMGTNRCNSFRILFTAIASGVVAMDDSLCETSEDESENRHCPGPETFNINVTDYSWRLYNCTGSPEEPSDNGPLLY